MIKPLKTIKKLSSGETTIIVALGDSLTQGWMVHKGYIDYFREMIENAYPMSRLVLIGRGVPGDTAFGGLHRLRRDVLNHNPDCVFVQFALNDAFMGYSPQQFRMCIQEIIEEIQADCDAEIVLITSSFLEDENEYNYVKRYYNQLDELAKEYGLPISRTDHYWKKAIDNGVDFGTLVQYDLVHPTAEGYRLMAMALLELFVLDENERTGHVHAHQ
ncbi:MAG: GDSL-type esterase/lipase family protein [Syntrophales bacterium]|nr:GDSL-type esterase/lipase family protein [Syntrophales bacterium]